MTTVLDFLFASAVMICVVGALVLEVKTRPSDDE